MLAFCLLLAFCKNGIYIYPEKLIWPKLEQPDCFRQPCLLYVIITIYCVHNYPSYCDSDLHLRIDQFTVSENIYGTLMDTN